MCNFLLESSKLSSTRLVLIAGTLTACLTELSVMFHIMYCTIHECQINWTGASFFTSTIAAFIATLLYGKVQQKKIEVKDNEDTNPVHSVDYTVVNTTTNK